MYAANIVTQMDIHIISHLYASFWSDFHFSSISTYRRKVHFVVITSAFKARFAVSRLLIEISSALVTRFSTHWKWSQFLCNVGNTRQHQTQIYTLEQALCRIGIYLLTYCVPPVMISNGFNDIDFLPTMTKNPGFLRSFSWVSHCSRKGQLLLVYAP